MIQWIYLRNVSLIPLKCNIKCDVMWFGGSHWNLKCNGDNGIFRNI